MSWHALALAAVALVVTTPVEADLPNHCVWGQVAGTWNFHLSKATSKKGEKCSKASSNYGGGDFGLGEPNYDVAGTVKVHLTTPNVATMKSNGKELKGTWTMIYDEGFEVRIDGKKFFAFSKYKKQGFKSTSYCHKTFPGWVHNSKHPDGESWGCYHGVKEGKSEESTHTLKLDSLLQESNTAYAPEHELVAAINGRKNGAWRAKVYPQFIGKNLGDMHSLGGQRVVEEFKTGSSAPVTELIEEDVSGLPKDFDWRNVKGENYINPVLNQGSCGSCYATSSLDALASRVRIKTKNKLKPNYSVERVLKCSEYSQGCKGGYGYLVGKYVQDFGATSNKTGTHGCKAVPKGKSSLRAMDYYYVGGYYGGSSWKGMMKEIHSNGPIVVGFNTNGWVYHYETGVLLDETTREAKTGKKTKMVNPWQPTTHAVVIIGWGESKEHGKYWVVKNSWGSNWGENGYFRIERGTNAHAIESKPVGVIPEVGQDVKVTDEYLDEMVRRSREEQASSLQDARDGVSLSPD